MFLKRILPLFLIFVCGITAWTLVWYKAIHIPLTHDEVATFLYYPDFSVWELMMYPDPWPNNHILNTILTKYCLAIFGQYPWAGRLPNVLSFALYFWAALQLSKHLFKAHGYWTLALMSFFIFNPYLLDFFSLSRGYGLSVALMLYAVWMLVKGFDTSKEKLIWVGLLFSMLASYANFTLLIFWCSATAMTAIFIWKGNNGKFLSKPNMQKTTALLLVSLGYLALIYNPIHKMQSTNQFEYWQSNGFYKDTIISLIDTMRYGSRIIDIAHDYFALLVVFGFLLSLGMIGYKWGKSSLKSVLKDPLFTTFSLLALSVLANIAQTIILGTPNLTGRTALCFYPLCIAMTGALFSSWLKPVNKKVWLVLILLVFGLKVWHMARVYQPDRVREWWYDADTYRVLDAIALDRAGTEANAVLQTSWFFRRSFQYYTQTGKADHIHLVDLDAGEEKTANPDYFFIFDSDLADIADRYEIIAKYDGGSRLLLKRKPIATEEEIPQ